MEHRILNIELSLSEIVPVYLASDCFTHFYSFYSL